MSDDERKEFWRSVFVLYDKDFENKIKASQLAKYLKAVGIVVDKKELNTALEEFGGKDKLEFEEIWNKFNVKPTLTDEEIVQAFKAFSSNGKINKEEMKFILTNLGDKISEDDVNEFFKYFKGDAEEFDFMEFLERYGIKA